MDPLVAREYIEGCLKIRTKSGAVVPFRLNPAQEKLYAAARAQQEAGKPVRLRFYMTDADLYAFRFAKKGEENG